MVKIDQECNKLNVFQRFFISGFVGSVAGAAIAEAVSSLVLFGRALASSDLSLAQTLATRSIVQAIATLGMIVGAILGIGFAAVIPKVQHIWKRHAMQTELQAKEVSVRQNFTATPIVSSEVVRVEC